MEVKEYEDIIQIRERLNNNIKKLAKNEASIGKKQLQEKYATAYAKLLDSIKEDANKYVNEIVFAVWIPSTKKDTIVSIINEEIMGGLKKDSSDAIFKEYDIEKLDSVCSLYNQRVHDIAEKMY